MMFMEEFATGFNRASATKPGFTLDNQTFSVTFSEVSCEQTKNIVSRGYENCYNWEPVMQLILDVVEDYEIENLIDIEAVSEEVISEWLISFEGWGLLASILDTSVHRHVLLSLAYTRDNWNEDTGGEYSDQKVFDAVKQVYSAMPGKQLFTLLPKFGLYFEEIVDGSKQSERKKELVLFFHAKWDLEVRFIVEKKRVNRSLVNLAAEAVARSILVEQRIVELPVPGTLFPMIRDKFCDAEWVRSYWSSQPDNTEHNTEDINTGDTTDHNDVADDRDEEDDERFLASLMLMPPLDPVLLQQDNNNNNAESAPTGIDKLLIIWVGIFLAIALIQYYVTDFDDEDGLTNS